MAEQSGEAARKERLSAQLRANLARRKAQKRARGEADSAAPAEAGTAPDSPLGRPESEAPAKTPKGAA
ncbi:MAG: hypothetical protein ACYYKD_12370 [Rhodospirillales bacterium]